MRTALYSLIALVAAAPAYAADLGTYRPGTPYHATQVPGADVCESTCAGDAQCRGWNYVKPAPQAPGVCELQSSVGAPVSSAISISGVNVAASPLRSNIVAGSTNTIRVGTSPASRPASRTVTAPSGRTIVRQPVPQPHAMPQPTAHRRPAMPAQPVMRAQPQTPRLAPMLDSGAAPRQPIAQPRQPAPHVLAPNTARPQMTAPAMAPRGPARSRAPRQTVRPPAAQGRPPIGQPIPPQPMTGVELPQGPLPRASASQPVTFEHAQASLYGNLHDDVRAPASNSPVPADPSAPIATSASRPVAPVQQEALAGAMRR